MKNVLLLCALFAVTGCAGSMPRPADAYSDGRELLGGHPL
jgi:hypothetical protein